MKLILSRKGFDSSYGGQASPLVNGVFIYSIPIPTLGVGEQYRNLQHFSVYVGPSFIKEEIYHRRLAHVDPDLRRGELVRSPGWRPLFGQTGAAASHLHSEGVGEGDLFLFFGWFRATEENIFGGQNGRMRYVEDAPDLHVAFGWLQVGEVYRLGEGEIPPQWACYHPHVQIGDHGGKHNTLYVTTERLTGFGLDLPGGGYFRNFYGDLRLTAPESRLRTLWKLPLDFWPFLGNELSYHSDHRRWWRPGLLSDEGNRPAIREYVKQHRLKEYSLQSHRYCYLESVPRGQEFVLDLNIYSGVKDWLVQLLSHGKEGA